MAGNYPNMIEEVNSLLQDENKCITYKFLCKHFSLKSVKEGRELLVKCVEQGDRRDEFVKTYFIGGISSESTPEVPVMHEYRLVRDKDLDLARSRFSKITTLHLYSIQLSEIQDLNCLYTADLGEAKDDIINAQSTSQIYCRKALSSETSTKPKLVEDVAIPDVITSTSDGNNPKEKAKVPARVPVAKQKPAVNAAKGSLKNLFMAQAEKKAATDKSSSKSSDTKKVFPSIENLYITNQQNCPNQTENKDEKKEHEKGNVKGDKCVIKQENSTVPITKTKSIDHKHKKPVLKKDSVPDKKRRRIIAVSDSSSDESDESHQSCGIMETADLEEEPPRLKKTVCHSPPPDGVRKKRKLVADTVLDDNGYLVTTKKWEHVSDSDEAVCEKEEEKSKNIEANKKTPPSDKESAANKNKQAVLTSFFRRK